MENSNLQKLAKTLAKEESANVKSPVKGSKPINRAKAKSEAWKKKIAEHERNLVYLLKNNTEIRRFTALGIINYLTKEGQINGTSKYVKFLWNKFQVCVDGINREYRYTEIFFLNALIASFESFSKSAQKTIATYIDEELNKAQADKVANEEDIKDIVSTNDETSDELTDVEDIVE